ncbi:MAG: EamA family transporter [Rhodobiaceae bacterium]|nr:EamA family transporter [Rhodobiaceae bacterium]MCC0013354.1 EamA family transporter [Rhodobiaceae bacterium]MCC0051344.1 EamA family transporter [Rhodobiaceae bacterium]MCC0061530.1 EamA family transporter [Rhodobiaceae bacterium]
MTSLGLALVLAAAICHATWNFFVKRIDGGPELIWLFSIVSVVLYLPLAIWIIAVEQPELGLAQFGFIAGSTILHLGYFLLLQTGYRKGDLSLIYPTARATGPILSSVLAITLLGEKLVPQMAVGAAIIILGVFFLTGGIRRNMSDSTASLLFGIGAGMLIGSYTAWDAHAVSVLLVPPLLLDYVSSLGRATLLAPIALRKRQLIASHWREHRLGVLAIAAFNPLAYILVLYALTFTPVTYVAPLREVSVLLTVLAGSFLLREGNIAQRLGWAAFILAGMTILVTG